MLRIGAFEVCITPPVGVEMAGYGPDLGRYATDIHDHLMGQALVLDDGQTRLAVVTADLLGVSAEFTRVVRGQVHKRTGIPPANILVCASHSHTAVTLRPMRAWGGTDVQYSRMVARHLSGAVVAAAGKLQPARLSVGHGEHHGLAWNRTGSGVVDPGVDVVRLDGLDGETLALLVLYACHPVILGPKPILSADYPGALRSYLADRYPGSVILFANGPCGDVDPATNQEVWGQGTFDDVLHAGAALGNDVIKIVGEAAPLNTARLSGRQETIRLFYNLPSQDFIRERIAFFAAEVRHKKDRDERFEAVTGRVTMPRFWLGYYRALEKRIGSGQQPAYEAAEIQAFTLGGTAAILAMPAEVYAEQGLAIRRASRHPFIMPVCYANDLIGYLPPRTEFENTSYTASLAAAVYDQPPFRSDVAEILVDSMANLLRKEQRTLG